MTDTEPIELAERHYIGALICRAGHPSTDARLLQVEDIADPQLVQVLAAIQVIATDVLPEPAEIVPAMLRNGLARQHAATATGLVVDLLTECPNPAATAMYAAWVRDAAARRIIRQVAQRLHQAADTSELENFMPLIEAELASVRAAVSHIG